ncbi:hypothetical protein [Vreelandella utahensis]|uniref:hypothetical protein n=1 Tax=Vreelandella halophila TaxID=86177 RepID=UPI0009851071|nr:hypothetical protein [Halomonas utahensis]
MTFFEMMLLREARLHAYEGITLKFEGNHLGASGRFDYLRGMKTAAFYLDARVYQDIDRAMDLYLAYFDDAYQCTPDAFLAGYAMQPFRGLCQQEAAA